ncbi:MAG: TIGR01212 family radical SAM protein [Deltaproteobacteria bacterium]|nr:TIGR01212 family radical SAM protein [Deltaproteobacteria bacterium]
MGQAAIAENISPSPVYHPISAHYRRLFGCKVYKVGVSVARDCPVRKVPRPGQGAEPAAEENGQCIFCDEWGAASHPERAGLTLAGQVREGRKTLSGRYGAEKFIVYLQAYTSTFARRSQLRAWLEEALAMEGVVGVALGTRPDCLPDSLLAMLTEISGQGYVSLELGLQTLDDAQLRFLRRGHDAACSLDALNRLAGHPRLDGCAHLMFGLPGETDRQLVQTARIINDSALTSVKLHNLHVLRGTELENIYRQGGFQPLELEEYARRVMLFLEHLSPRIAVHRLGAVASRWEDVVAPDWVREKMGPRQYILDRMQTAGSWQGKMVVTSGLNQPPG